MSELLRELLIFVVAGFLFYGAGLVYFLKRELLNERDYSVFLLTVIGYATYILFQGVYIEGRADGLRWGYALLGLSSGLIPWGVTRALGREVYAWHVVVALIGVLFGVFCFTDAFPPPSLLLRGCTNTLSTTHWALWMSVGGYVLFAGVGAALALVPVLRPGSTFQMKRGAALTITFSLSGLSTLIEALALCGGLQIPKGWAIIGGGGYAFGLYVLLSTHLFETRARCIELEKGLERYQVIAIRDPLTGLYNRGYLMETLSRALERLKRGEGKFGLIFIDLDNFKEINDKYGHQAGDYILSAVGKLLMRNCRAYDCPARYGGDEFMIFVWSDRKEAFTEMVNRIANTLNTLELNIAGKKFRISATIGAYYFDRPVNGIEELVALVDKAMYEGKGTGKGKVVIR